MKQHTKLVPVLFCAATFLLLANGARAFEPRTRVEIAGGRWQINGEVTCRGARAEGLLMNVRMVNAVFEDRNRADFDPEANADKFITRIPDYVAHGVRAFTLNLQGGAPGYEGALNTAINPDGTLREEYLRRVQRVIEACDQQGAVVILGCFYQRQDQRLKDEAAVRAAVVNVARWIRARGFANVILEIANEYGHKGYDHAILKSHAGQSELIRLARQTAGLGAGQLPLLISTSALGDGMFQAGVAADADFLLIHFNNTPLKEIPARVKVLKSFGKPIVCNEDVKDGIAGAKAAAVAVANGASWGLMLEHLNQKYPFAFNGAADDPDVYAAFKQLTTPNDYFPPPESQGGWRKLEPAGEIREIAGMDAGRLAGLKQWLLDSDNRKFAALVIRHGYVVLEVERGEGMRTNTGNVKSCAKAVCATVLGIASEESQRGNTPRKMSFDDPAFTFIPWAQPLSDPRKTQITVRQLFNHTSGITPEVTGAKNRGPWEYVLGFTGDTNTAKLAFDPGTAAGYSTHALYHAALVCENVTGRPYDQFALEKLFRPIGIERAWFEYFDGREGIGRHPSHAFGMPARELARIAYCMLHNGRWEGRQIIPEWFVAQTADPSHSLRGIKELRFKSLAEEYSHGWQLPAMLEGAEGRGIPRDARYKPGSGGQLIAFVPSLDLVIARQTGDSGQWEYAEYLRRACAAVLENSK